MTPLVSRSCLLGLALFFGTTVATLADTQQAGPPGTIGDDERYDTNATLGAFSGNLAFFRQMSEGNLPGFPDPNEDEFLSHMIGVLEASIEMLESREYIAAGLFRDVLGDWHAETGKGTSDKISAYAMIRAVFPVLAAGTTDAKALYQRLTQTYGRDPEEYYHELTATLRPAAIRPPFRIGEVVVESKDRTDRMTDAANRLRQAQSGFNSSQKLLDEARTEFDEEAERFWRTHGREQERIRPLEEAYRSQMERLRRAENDRIAGVSTMMIAQAGQIERMRRRVEVIGERLLLADEVYGGPEIARIQKARLAAERDDLTARLASIDAGPGARTEAQLRATSRHAQELFDRWDLEKRHSNRVIARAGRDLELIESRVQRLRAEVAKAEKERNEAATEWREALIDSRLGLGQISSNDYLARFMDGLPEIAELDALVRQIRENLRLAELAHWGARRDMLNQNNAVASAAGHLIDMSYASALGQTGVEFTDQIREFAATFGKAGPYAAFAEAAAAMFWNTASPPTVFDAPSAPFSIPTKDEEGFWDTAAAVGTKAAKIGTKYAVDQTVRAGTIVRLSELLDAQRESIRTGGFDQVDEVRDILLSQRKKLQDVVSEFDTFAGRKGGGSLALAFGADLLKGQIKDEAKDAMKKLIAEFVEGPAVSRYFDEQMRLAHAIRIFRMSGAMARDLRDQLEILLPEREALMENFDSQAGILVDRNRQFLAKGGYTFFLYSSEDIKHPDERGTSGDIDARVYLQGVELVGKRVEYGQQFTIRAEDEDRFDSSFPEMLTLTIELQ